MCLAVPARVIHLDVVNQTALVDLGGVQKHISLALVENVQLNDYLLVHVGFALSKIDPVEAKKTLSLIAQIGVGDIAP